MNMLIAEYDYDVDIAVQREEEREIALKEGIAPGLQHERIYKVEGTGVKFPVW